MPFYNLIDDPSNFVISFTEHPRNDFGIFAKGYSRAASSIAEELLSRTPFPDYEAYPVVFLYRHALELHIKNIIYKATLLSQFKRLTPIDVTLHSHHKLTLSKEAAKLLTALFPDDTQIERMARNVVQLSSEFSEIDPDSYAYRYPINKNGNQSTAPHQMVNLSSLHAEMSEVLEQLEVIDFGLDVEKDKTQEIHEILEGLIRITAVE